MESNKVGDTKLISSIKSLFLYDSNQKISFYKNFTEQYNLENFKKNLEQKNLILFSQNELRFNNLIPFDTSILEFIKLFGKPNFSKISDINPKIQSLIYKTKIADIGSRCNLIFHENKLVMFNYVFTALTKQERNILLQYSLNKYGNKLNNTNYQIIDNTKNSLFIKNTKNLLVFSFYAPTKVLNRTFECKPKEKRVILFKDIKKIKKAIQN